MVAGLGMRPHRRRHDRTGLFIGYLVGAAIMILGGVVEWLIGINAEGKSLEAITKPLTAAEASPATA